MNTVRQNGLYASNATLDVFSKGEAGELAGSGGLARLNFDDFRALRARVWADPELMPTFEERCLAAARAGFAGFSLGTFSYQVNAAQRRRDVKTLRSFGLEVTTVETSRNSWFASRAEVMREWLGFEEQAYEAAEAFGAKRLLVYASPLIEMPPPDAFVERFAALCDRAAEHELEVGLEFVAGTQISTPAEAWDVVRGAGRANGGIIADSFSFFRGGGTFEMLRAIPAERIFAVQLADAAAQSDVPLFEEALRGRSRPGEGTLNIVGFIQTLDDIGVTASYEVELHSDTNRGLSVEEAARGAYEATMRVLETARR